MRDMTSEEIAAFNEGRCPCGSTEVYPGPEGGSSLNVTCEGCGTKWNLYRTNIGFMGGQWIGPTR